MGIELQIVETKNHNSVNSLFVSLVCPFLGIHIVSSPGFRLRSCPADRRLSLKPLHHKTHFLFSGDNILAVLRYLATSEKLADSSAYRHGNMVFFDLLGVVVVAYPARVGTILNYMVATATFLYLAKKASLPGNRGRSPFPVVDSCYVISCPGCVCCSFSSLWKIRFVQFQFVGPNPNC